MYCFNFLLNSLGYISNEEPLFQKGCFSPSLKKLFFNWFSLYSRFDHCSFFIFDRFLLCSSDLFFPLRAFAIFCLCSSVFFFPLRPLSFPFLNLDIYCL